MNIFVTVGTQLPFDRLIVAVDQWAGGHPAAHLVAQTGRSDYRPRHIEWAESIDAGEFRARLLAARAVVSHAGMGSIISALELGRPIVVMPRLARFGEHRNDHQSATARHLQGQRGVRVVWDERELTEALDALATIEAITPPIANFADSRLLAAIRAFIDTGVSPVRFPSMPAGASQTFEIPPPHAS
jgi:UDP-N-acetylglucosamine transferase subunit ALG13